MQRCFLLVSIFLVATSCGCMVLDEIDNAAAKMPSASKASVSEEAAPGSAGTPQQNPLLEQSKEWWSRATSIAPGGLESSIVKCRLRGATHYMSRDDCLGQGGTPASVSG
jgi:hypothetical protein